MKQSFAGSQQISDEYISDRFMYFPKVLDINLQQPFQRKAVRLNGWR